MSRGARGRPAPGPRAGRPRRRRPSRCRRGCGRGRGRRAERAPRPLPNVPPRRRGRSGPHARPRRSRGEPAAAGAGAGEAGDRAARQRRRRSRRVAHAVAAADRSGDGQGRRGPGVLALCHIGVARRGRRVRRATGRCRSRRRAARAPCRDGVTVADDVVGRDDPRHQALRGRPCRGTRARRPVAAVRRAGGRVVRRARLALLDRSVDPVAGAADSRHHAGPRWPTVVGVPGQGRPRGRRAYGVDRSRRTVRTPARPPRRRPPAVAAGGGLARRARRTGPGGDAGDARRAADGSRCRRHLPRDGGVPVPARRPRQPQPTRPRGTRRAGRWCDGCRSGRTVGPRGDDAARPAGASRARPCRLPAAPRRRAARRLRPPRSCRRAGAGDDRSSRRRTCAGRHRRLSRRASGATCFSTTNPTSRACSTSTMHSHRFRRSCWSGDEQHGSQVWELESAVAEFGGAAAVEDELEAGLDVELDG